MTTNETKERIRIFSHETDLPKKVRHGSRVYETRFSAWDRNPASIENDVYKALRYGADFVVVQNKQDLVFEESVARRTLQIACDCDLETLKAENGFQGSPSLENGLYVSRAFIDPISLDGILGDETIVGLNYQAPIKARPHIYLTDCNGNELNSSQIIEEYVLAKPEFMTRIMELSTLQG